MKARLSNGFLKVTTDDKLDFLAWFPYWRTINPDFLKELADANESLVAVENRHGLCKFFRVPDNKLASTWLNNKANKECRIVLMQCVNNFNDSYSGQKLEISQWLKMKT